MLTVLGVLVSVAVVAVASRGELPVGEAGGRKPSEAFVDVVFTLYLVMLAAGAIFFVYLLALQRRIKRDAGIMTRSPLSWFVIAVLLLVGLVAARRMQGLQRRPPAEETLITGDVPTPAPTTTGQDDRRRSTPGSRGPLSSSSRSSS